MKKAWKLVMIAALAGLPFILIGGIFVSMEVHNRQKLPKTREYALRLFELHNGWEGRRSPLDYEDERHLNHLYSASRGVIIKNTSLGQTTGATLAFGCSIPFRAELEDGRIISGVFEDPGHGTYLWLNPTQGEISGKKMAEFDVAAAHAISAEAQQQKAKHPDLEWLMIASDESDYKRNSFRAELSKGIKRIGLEFVGLRYPQEKPTILIYSSWMIGKKGIRVDIRPLLVGVKNTEEDPGELPE